MDVKVMTIVSSQSIAYNLMHDENSFARQLLIKNSNFQQHTDALLDMETQAMENKHRN